MTMKKQIAFLLAVFAMTLTAPTRAQAQSKAAAYGPWDYPGEVSLGYTYVHTNAPPGGCGCFSMNGATLQVVYPIPRSLSIVQNVSLETQKNAAGTNTSLTLGSIMAGVRYRRIHGKWEPFAEAMVGGTQATGGFSRIGIAQDGSSFVFTGLVGGGLDRRITPRWAVRLVDVDYFPTTFNNGADDHQNNLKVTAGVVFHF
jgi:peptidoglycan-associated lipoprotein